MRLDFNILWVEDQRAAVEQQRVGIERALRKSGFRANAEFAASVEDAKKYLSDDVYGDHIDLVLMDYNLGSSQSGVVGIQEVQDKFPFKEIIFYSANSTSTLRDALKTHNILGVFISSREDLVNTVTEVFQSLVKKVLDIEHSRGIVMGATGEIDHFILEALLALFSKVDDTKKTEILTSINEKAGERQKDIEKIIQKIKNMKNLDSLADYHAVYTSVHRLGLLRSTLGSEAQHTKVCESMLSYEKNIIPKRNDLAHVQVERKGFSRKLFVRDGNGGHQEFKKLDMQELLVKLLDHHESFEKMVEAIHEQAASS